MRQSSDPTGRRFHIESAGMVAEIAELGAALRSLRADGVDLVPRYPDGAPTPAASGIVLVPWPNRVAGGSWAQHGTSYQLAITEPAYGNASHGLLRFTPYRQVAASEDSVTLGATVFPQTGYPFHLETTVTYAVSAAGLIATHHLVNVGAREAPVAVGAHPYVMIGGADTAELELQLSARTRLEVDDRLIPVAHSAVDAATDLRHPRRVGGLSLDTAFTDIDRDPAGRIRATLRAPDGRALTVWGGPDHRYLQVFTTDRYPGQELAVAIEPMTAPANAFNSGRDLRWLAPGDEWGLSWGIDFQTE